MSDIGEARFAGIRPAVVEHERSMAQLATHASFGKPRPAEVRSALSDPKCPRQSSRSLDGSDFPDAGARMQWMTTSKSW